MATGIVTTTSLTHATPAAFSAHVTNRSMEAEIASQQIEQRVDLMFGAGLRQFLPSGEHVGTRSDGRNLIREAESSGYRFIDERAGLDESPRLPVLGLFASEHLPYEIDRDALRVPSLSEMTRSAIDLLSASADGFVLVVEGGRIDHARHGNDAAAHLFDALAYDDAVREALRFARTDGETLVVATSDHETGGLSLGTRIDGASHYA